MHCPTLMKFLGRIVIEFEGGNLFLTNLKNYNITVFVIASMHFKNVRSVSVSTTVPFDANLTTTSLAARSIHNHCP